AVAASLPAVKAADPAVAASLPAVKAADSAVIMTAPEPNTPDSAAVVAVSEDKTPEQVISAKQNIIDTAVEPDINSVVMNVQPAQMNLPRTNDKIDKKQSKDESPTVGVEGAPDTENVLPATILSTAMPVEAKTPVNNLTHEDAAKENMPSFAKPSTNEAKPNVPTKTPDIALQGTAVSGLPVQSRQDFDVHNAVMAGQVEKVSGAEPQPLVLDGEKSPPRIGGADIAQFRPVDNKADIPAITKPLSHPEWNKDLGERIVWMSSRAIPAAEIRLNPQHLGPVSVRVNVTDDQATVLFTAQNATTREALEASIPKLREMMNAQQLNLTDVTVAHGSASDQGRPQAQQFAQTADRQGRNAAVDGVDGVDDVEQDIDSGRAEVSNGLLSLYA
ncbi:MAG: flagellar hook-length control protein FliK, partial [Methylobacter sp.]